MLTSLPRKSSAVVTATPLDQYPGPSVREGGRLVSGTLAACTLEKLLRPMGRSAPSGASGAPPNGAVTLKMPHCASAYWTRITAPAPLCHICSTHCNLTAPMRSNGLSPPCWCVAVSRAHVTGEEVGDPRLRFRKNYGSFRTSTPFTSGLYALRCTSDINYSKYYRLEQL